MQQEQQWGEYFKELYRGKYNSLSKLADDLSSVGVAYGTPALSRYQSGKRQPQDRQIHLELIEAFVRLTLIEDSNEANKWLSLAGLGYLTPKELARFFPLEADKAKTLASGAPHKTGSPSSQAGFLESPDHPMSPDSYFYIDRREDQDFRKHIKRPGVTITIKGPGQVGKSSMLNRVMPTATAAGKKVVRLDFQLFDESTRANGKLFFRHFCEQLTHKLKIVDRIQGYWQWSNKSQNCTDYMSDYVLQTVAQSLILMMDKVEVIFDTDFCTDFFGMVRNWHNSRAIQPIWKKLDLVFVTSTEPLQFIPNNNLSPFNVGFTIPLVDFTLDEVAELNCRHNSPLNTYEVQRLMNLVAGHPYLTRQALYQVASKRFTSNELFNRAADDDGPFRLHLQRHLQRLQHRPEQQRALKQVIEQKDLSDVNLFFRLQGAGLIRREKHQVLSRCQLYADYFGARL